MAVKVAVVVELEKEEGVVFPFEFEASAAFAAYIRAFVDVCVCDIADVFVAKVVFQALPVVVVGDVCQAKTKIFV